MYESREWGSLLTEEEKEDLYTAVKDEKGTIHITDKKNQIK